MKIAVIGAGTIGASWAAYFLSRGLSVTASDPSPGAPDLIRRMVEAAWPILMRLGGKADANPNAWRFEADPVAAVAGTLMTASTLGDTSPLLKWSFAIIAGGGVSSIVHMGTSALRAAVSLPTGGLANPVVSSGEGLGAIVLTLLALFLAPLAFIIVLWMLYRIVKRFRQRLAGPTQDT